MIRSVGFLLLFLNTGAAMATEEPQFTVETKTDQYEIRRYEPVIVAETKVDSAFEDAGNQGFRVLADYIFGNNKTRSKISMTAPVSQQPASEKIAMTAPVTQAGAGSGFVVQFTMPRKFSMATIPAPNDPRVILREIPGRTIAVFRYSGTWSQERYQAKLDEFRARLKKDGVATTGEPVFARYNPPFLPWFLRRNEIWLETVKAK
jgi:hypothetical protein